MTKKTSFLAIVICLMMIFPSHADAFWLDIIKSLAKGVIGIVTEQTKKSVAPASGQVATPTQQDTTAALKSLQNACQELVKQGFPCGVGDARSAISCGRAREQAEDRAIGALAKSMGTFVDRNAKDIYESIEEFDDEENYKLIEKSDYKRTMDLATKQEVNGAQPYFTYERQVKMGNKEVCEVWVASALNPALFEKALEEVAQGKPLGQQILSEAAKGFASKIKDLFRKKK